jgi:16S rRNA (cytosine1402-N4)-methyltransferase
MDLGLSSMQIDRAERGFSYMQEGPLDMRMDPTRGDSAAALLETLDAAELRRLLAELGESHRPGRIARAIVTRRERGEMGSTGDLRRAVESVVGRARSASELARVFQALRIRVNGELDALDAALAALPDALQEGGRAVVISYHSLEDRRVKQLFVRESKGCVCPPELPICACGRQPRYESLTRRVMRPSAQECERNPRARSARLRAVRRIVA